jgi:hypothetical protein
MNWLQLLVAMPHHNNVGLVQLHFYPEEKDGAEEAVEGNVKRLLASDANLTQTVAGARRSSGVWRGIMNCTFWGRRLPRWQLHKIEGVEIRGEVSSNLRAF